jgi:hypothetical protein
LNYNECKSRAAKINRETNEKDYLPRMKIKELSGNIDIPDNITGIVEYCDGTEFPNNYVLINHYKNGLVHNEKGKAIVWHDGKGSWGLLGVRLLKKEWQAALKNGLISK